MRTFGDLVRETPDEVRAVFLVDADTGASASLGYYGSPQAAAEYLTRWERAFPRAESRRGTSTPNPHAKLAALGIGPMTSSDRLRTALAPPQPHLRMIGRLAFLAPDLQDAILDGRVPADLNVAAATRADLPLAWADQRSALGIRA
jgi:hypothetical protein